MDTPSKIGEEHNTVESNCLLQTQTRPKKFRKTSSNYDYTECVPGDVIFEILVRVPAQDVHNSARLVCRKWHKIVNTRDFKHAHLHRSTFGLIVNDLDMASRHHMTFIANGSKALDDDDPIEISKLGYRPQFLVLSSYNGLILEARVNRSFYVSNPITKQKLRLPPFFSKSTRYYESAIAYVDTTMEYKVVRSFIRCFRKRESQPNCVAILTLGVDKDWTCRVNTQHLSLKAKKLLAIPFPLTTQGFVHWARDERTMSWAGYERKYEHLLTLNVETEIITQFQVPSISRKEDGLTQVIYLPMGSYLSLLILRSEFSWELWEMKPETGEWTQMPSIDLLEAQFVRSRDYVLEPVGWLRPREVLLFNIGQRCCFTPSRFNANTPTRFCFAFTVRTRKLQKFELDGSRVINKFLVHRNSLVRINDAS